jgi:hypothetical protein
MENLYDKVVKLTAEILKSWTPEQGVVSPFSSSSSMHPEENDNHLEYYVQPDSKVPLRDAIASIFNSNFWTNGGEKMTEKTLDVDASTTEQAQYENAGASTTEPDPQSEIAITKSLDGEGTFSTTANTTEEAPAKGETTEPTTKADGGCPDCGKELTLCECAGMTKAEGDKCPHCGQAMPVKKSDDADEDDKVEKAADEPESKEEDAKETPEDEKKEEMKKSLWAGTFSPNIKRGM